MKKPTYWILNGEGVLELLHPGYTALVNDSTVLWIQARFLSEVGHRKIIFAADCYLPLAWCGLH
jgi:hypothetical protein